MQVAGRAHRVPGVQNTLMEKPFSVPSERPRDFSDPAKGGSLS